MTKPLIAVVDDDEGVRDSLSALFDVRGHPVASYDRGSGLLGDLAKLTVGCILLDVRLPDMNGLDVQTRLREAGYGGPVVVMTGFADVPLAVSAMKAGAFDFVQKPFRPGEIYDIVEAALKTAPPAAAEDEEAAGRLRESLTQRELEVLELLVEGHQNKMVARTLGISPRTAEVHRANIMKKLGATSFSHLVRMALAAGISPNDP